MSGAGCRACGQQLVFVKQILGEESGHPVALFKCDSCSSFFSRLDFARQRQEEMTLESLDGYLLNEAYLKNRVADILRRIAEKGWMPSSDATMLDIGCGVGYSLVVAGEKGIRARGVEPVKPAAQYAAGVLKLDVINALFSADLFALEQFDLIIIDQVLEHLPNPAQVLGEALRLLKRDGILFLAVPPVDWSRKMASVSFQLPMRIRRWFEGNRLTRRLGAAAVKYDSFRFPEGHINYLSAEAISILADRCNANVLEQYHINRSRARRFPRLRLSTGSFFLKKRQ